MELGWEERRREREAVREESKAASVLKNRAKGESEAGFPHAEETPIWALLEGTGFGWG